jgi:predicted RNA binding protein YcfA (HicA-like mRNA interferase family)
MPRITNVKFKDLERFILKEGCTLDRVKGDHFIYKKENIARPLVIPNYKTLPEFIVINNLKILGKSKKDLLDFLNLK